MRRLLLLRHAKAERAVPSAPDRARKLDERGRKDAATMGAYLATHELLPDHVLVSPAVRTQETAKLAAAGWRPARETTTVKALYDAMPGDIFTAIQQAPAAAQTVLVIAHNPGLHELALMLIATGDIDAREALREKLPTSGLVIIDFAYDTWTELHPESGRLDRFVGPRSLEAATS